MMKQIFFLLILFCCGFSISAAERSDKFPGNRFLFVVETSSAMNRSAKAARETVHALIESGMQGQMRAGDTFSLWTFNEKLDADYPLQRWIPEQNKNLATTAAEFLKKKRFEKKAQLSVMLPSLYSVIKSSKAISVVLISTGNEPIEGTPFDKEINGVYPVYARELREAKMPFVTIMVGRNGKLVAYSVNSSLSIQIPNPPLFDETALSQSKTNSPAITNKLTAVKTNQTAPVKFAKNIIMSKPVATNQPPITNVVAKDEKKTGVENTNSVAAIISSNATPTNIQSRVAETNSKIVAAATAPITPTEAVPAPIPTQVAAIPSIQDPKDSRVVLVEKEKTPEPALLQPSIVAHDGPKTFKPETQAVESVEKTTPKPQLKIPQPLETESNLRQTSTLPNSPTPMAVAQPPPAAARRFLLPFIGIILFAGIVCFFFVQKSRNKSRPSLISRSMDQRPK
jgi:hypothetical protein